MSNVTVTEETMIDLFPNVAAAIEAGIDEGQNVIIIGPFDFDEKRPTFVRPYGCDARDWN